MFGFFQRKNHLRDCLYVLNSLDSEFGNDISWPWVRDKASTLLKNNSSAIRDQIVLKERTPKSVTLSALGNILFDEIATGRNHIYRGSLSLTGSSCRTMFLKLVQIQVSNGYISEEEAKNARENLEAAMKNAG